jgi:hypothetical protein
VHIRFTQGVGDLAAAAASQRNHRHFPLVGGFDGGQDIGRIAAGRQR